MKRPSDLELMAFADGELDDERAAEIAAFLAEGSEAARVVDAVHDLGEGVRATAKKPADVEIADDVMAAIERLEAASRNAASIRPPARHRSVRPSPPVTAARTRIAPPAAIGVVLAIAAGLFIWSRASVPEPMGIADATLRVPATEAPQGDPGDDRPPGAEVTAVDFGGAQGAIFYVPGQANTATAVVWIAEDPQ